MNYRLVVWFTILSAAIGAAEMPLRPQCGQWPPVMGAWFWTQKDLKP